MAGLQGTPSVKAFFEKILSFTGRRGVYKRATAMQHGQHNASILP